MSAPSMCQAGFAFELGFDLEAIKTIARHRRIWPHISDDLTPAAIDWVPPTETTQYLLCRDEEGLLGFWALTSQTSTCWEVHTCLLPRAYGDKARRAATQAIAWVFAHTQCTRLVTSVPAYNKLALRLAEHAGMTEYGFNPESFLKDGTLHGQHLLGITKCL